MRNQYSCTIYSYSYYIYTSIEKHENKIFVFKNCFRYSTLYFTSAFDFFMYQ